VASTAEIAVARDGAASAAARSWECLRCNRPFVPRTTGGRRQVFCSVGCRRAHDAAARAAGRAAIEGERTAVPTVVSGLQPTRALQQQHEAPPPGLSEGAGDPALADALSRFLIQVPRDTVELLIRYRRLRPNEEDDVLAILIALRRAGLAATVTRIA
jgi:hypothetical protein